MRKQFINILLCVTLMPGMAMACDPPSGGGGSAMNAGGDHAPGPSSGKGGGGSGGGGGVGSGPAGSVDNSSDSSSTDGSTGGFGKKTRAPEREAIEVEPTAAPLAAVLWSCGCSNINNKICSEGFNYNSISGASAAARSKCGQSCIPDCKSQAASHKPAAVSP